MLPIGGRRCTTNERTSTAQWWALTRCGMGSGRTADTHFSSALLHALSTVLRRRFSLHYALALHSATAVLSSVLRWLSSLCYTSAAQRRLPRLQSGECSRGAKEGAGPA